MCYVAQHSAWPLIVIDARRLSQRVRQVKNTTGFDLGSRPNVWINEHALRFGAVLSTVDVRHIINDCGYTAYRA